MIMITSVIGLNGCCNHEADVPEKVKTAFSEKFPDAKKIVWEQEDENEWEAEFKMNGKEYSASYNADGSWIETEYEIKTNEIPEAAKNTLDTEFTGFEIEEGEFIENPEGNFYEFEIEKEEKGKEEIEMSVVIDATGKIVKKETLKDDDDDDDDACHAREIKHLINSM